MGLPEHDSSMKCSKWPAWEFRFSTISCLAAKLVEVFGVQRKRHWKLQLEFFLELRGLSCTWLLHVVVLLRKFALKLNEISSPNRLTSSFFPCQPRQIDIAATWCHNGSPFPSILNRARNLRVKGDVSAVEVLARQSVKFISLDAVRSRWLIR